MEEDIKNLSEIIELCEEEINNNDENVSAILDLTDLKSLRNLIKEYKNLKEIEESHRKENGKLRERVKELEEWNEYYRKEMLSKEYIRLNYIPKSKVEEKIEEVNKQYDFYNSDRRETKSIAKGYYIAIQKLQELLEKRK